MTGPLQREWLEREVGPVSLRVHRGIEDLLDPQCLLDLGEGAPP